MPPIDLSILDAETFQQWIVEQRWFGSKARDVAHIEISECVPLREEPPMLALALVEARFGEGTHETYQVPIGLRPADGGLERAGDRGGGRADVLRRARRPGLRAGAAAPHAQRRRGERVGRRAAVPVGGVGGRGPRRHGRRAAGRRRAVQLVDRVRRGADPEGLPAGGAGREPGARAAALPVRARVPEHRLAGRVVRVRGPVRRRHAGHPAGVPGGRPRRLGAGARAAHFRP